MNLLNKLKEQSGFTNTERQVANYIYDNLDNIASMTIGELAKKTYSSNATIIRLCRKLKYQGFKDFKFQLAREIEDLKFTEQSIDFTIPFDTSESTLEIVNKISSLYKESIDIIRSSIQINNLDQIVSSICLAKRVFIFSVGDTNLTVKNFMNKLMKINFYPILATENHEELAMSLNVKQDDLVLFVTYRGQSQLFFNCLKIISQTNCKIVTITANESSILTKFSDFNIFIPHEEKNNRITTFYSQLSFNYILSILYSLIYVRLKG